MSTVYDVKAVLDEREPTSRMQQLVMIATTIPFAVVAPPIAGVLLVGMVALRWDLRQDLRWWALAASGIFLPWIYIIIVVAFIALGGTKPRVHYHLTAVR